MIPSDLRPIVEGLLMKAQANQVNWVAAADLGLGGDTDDVVVTFPDYAINIYRTVDENGVEHVVLNLLNSKGKRIHGTSARPNDPDYYFLNELLGHGSRKVTGVDRVLADLQRVLEQDGVIGSATPKRGRSQTDESIEF